MTSAWEKIVDALEQERLLAACMLNPGATPAEISDLELHLGIELPPGLKAFLSEHNGQSDKARVGIYQGSQLLSTHGIRARWDSWRAIDEADMNADCAEFMSSKPEGVIKPMYTNPRWIPLTHDYGGNHIGLDYDPDTKGTTAQVIAFGRDEDQKVLVADSFDEFLTGFVAELHDTDWTMFPEEEREPRTPPRIQENAPTAPRRSWWKSW
ncbi:SMI1/KNR4 family protein [Flavobacterium sp. MXW15]|uniref:SMI1/KNR4 family protein n=1 Tax=Xanthomonas chitinilytica TaxID=2989819 RepID=A0ABT3JUY6_9XANT|nr:SMI1/KNR4 family protein [Xanthomonas sp. H13-6]MCW4453348.1 SMI1/KNR4 family protein [Flavobacterium sp. MXW15]MCW4472299.1 SMI1/KNR4 family protein [Xanthomonas sp. H13-6]